MFMCLLVLISFIVFFFKQKTAYDMRISDWSSDVCSSDLFGHILCAQHEDKAPPLFDTDRDVADEDRGPGLVGRDIDFGEQAGRQTATRIGQDRARAARPRRTVETVADEVQPRHSGAAVFEADADLGLGALTAAVGERAKIGRPVGVDFDVERIDREIGSAPWREGGGEYEWISVVAGLLKKKKK